MNHRPLLQRADHESPCADHEGETIVEFVRAGERLALRLLQQRAMGPIQIMGVKLWLRLTGRREREVQTPVAESSGPLVQIMRVDLSKMLTSVRGPET
eukprot:jgi/Botrbrau1/14433/Bobra.0014s0079.1